MNSGSTWRARRVLRVSIVAVIAAILAPLLVSNPGRAALPWEADIENRMPDRRFTLHIAEFGTGDVPGVPKCRTQLWDGTIEHNTCRRYLLPALNEPRINSDDELKGFAWDTDGFTIAETNFTVAIRGVVNWTGTVQAGTFFDLNDSSDAFCELRSGRPYCEVRWVV